MRHDLLSLGPHVCLTEAVLSIGALDVQGLKALFAFAPHELEIPGRAISVSLSRLDELLGSCALAPILPTALAGAVRKRQLSFLGGRLCAERALAELGLPFASVPSGQWGEPCWPERVRGSVSHTSTHAYAFATTDDRCLGIGIDSEEVAETAASAIVDLCCTGAERKNWLGRQPDAARVTTIFCAKEAVYKAAHAMVRRFIGFDEVETVAFNPETLTLRPVEGGLLDGVLRDVRVHIASQSSCIHAATAIGPENLARQHAPAASDRT